MLSKCANPECTAPFHYLHDGKLFQIDTSAVPQSAGPQLVNEAKPAHRIEYFWLCTQCSSSMTLAFQHGKGVVTVPLTPAAVRRAVAS
jgi:hypothetical protein